ncbi:MAG: signal recognition particle-docking protein FtsY [Desulfobacteraceae bacterium]|jgi:fused signal recognition particle receptor
MAFNWFKKSTSETKSDDKQGHGSNNEVEAGPDADLDSQIDEPANANTRPTPPSAEMDTAISSPEAGDQAGTESKDLSCAGEPDCPPQKQTGLFKRLKSGLSKTRDILTTDIDKLFSSKKQVDEDLLEELEELLITSDIGVQTTMALMKTITKKAAKIQGPEALKETLKQELLSLLEGIQTAPSPKTAKPHVIMVVGVNGVGKTTTIGKLAARATAEGERVLIAAADTFRAAAIEQLTIWAQRAGADIVKHKADADPAAVAFDSMEAALARGVDTVFVDTAGRLHTKVNLMEELKKIKRTITKKIPDAPHEVLLVLDATTGQNALSQAKLFHDAIGVSGLALTKLDGTAKGGIVISISQALNIPLQFIGVGEGIEDLQLFDPELYADALF